MKPSRRGLVRGETIFFVVALIFHSRDVLHGSLTLLIKAVYATLAAPRYLRRLQENCQGYARKARLPQLMLRVFLVRCRWRRLRLI